MVRSACEILDRAIAGRMTGTLTVPPDEGRQWPVRLLAHEVDGEGLWVEPLNASDQPIDPLATGGSQVQVAICIDHARFAFRSSIARRDRHFWLTESLMFSALLLGGPIELVDADRRAHPRFQVPDSTNIFSQITCRSSVLPLRVKPWDASTGGVSFLLPREQAAMVLARDDSIEFAINYRGRTTSGRGLVRFTRLITQRILKIGVQFDRDSMNDLSQQNLDHFLADAARLARPAMRF